MNVQRKALLQSVSWILFASIACILMAQPAAAQECKLETPLNGQRTTTLPNNKIFPIEVGGDPLNILFHWDDLPNDDVSPRDDVPDIVQTLVDQIDTTLGRLDAAGFRKIPGVRKCNKRNVYTVYVYQTGICMTDNGPAECAPGGNGVADAFDFRFSKAQKDAAQIDTISRNIIAHELFHSVQLNYPLSDPQQYLIEGTATLMPDLIDPDLDGTRNDLPVNMTGGDPTCEVVYLQNPWFNLVRRFNERFKDGSNVCSTKLFWRYFLEQVGRNQTEPSVGIDALVELFRLISDQPSGWRINKSDKIIGSGDFDGDGREELLVRSKTHIGLIASTFGRNRILNVTAFGARLGQNGWLLNKGDHLSFIGDFNDDGKDEVIISSRTHIGFIGLDRNQKFQTHNSVLYGAGRFGDGWVPRVTDRILGVADVDGDGSDEVLLKSQTYVGVVGLTPLNETRSVAIRSKNGLNADTLRVLSSSARVGASGDMNGDGHSEFVIKDARGIYALGLGSAGDFVSLASLDWREPIPTPAGGSWSATVQSEIRGVADLGINGFGGRGRDELLIQDRNDFAILGFDEVAGFFVRSTQAVGDRFSDESTYTRDMEIVAVHDMDEAGGAEIVFRRGDEIGVLKPDPATLELTQIGSRSNAEFRRGKLSFARLNGGSAAHIVNQSPTVWRTLAYHKAPGLIEESLAQVGKYLDDLISRMDELVRARTSGQRDFASLWRDFAITLYVKNLNVSSLDPAYYFVDEQSDGYEYHYRIGFTDPPVTRAGMDGNINDIQPYTDSGRKDMKINRWSSQYFRVLKSNNAGQNVLVNVIPERGQGRLSATVVIMEGDQLVQMDRDANPRGGVMLKSYDLAPGQELGLIIAAAYDAPEYVAQITSTLDQGVTD